MTVFTDHRDLSTVITGFFELSPVFTGQHGLAYFFGERNDFDPKRSVARCHAHHALRQPCISASLMPLYYQKIKFISKFVSLLELYRTSFSKDFNFFTFSPVYRPTNNFQRLEQNLKGGYVHLVGCWYCVLTAKWRFPKISPTECTNVERTSKHNQISSRPP